MTQFRPRVASNPRWRPVPDRPDTWRLDLAPANRRNAPWPALSVEGIDQCIAYVWFERAPQRRFAWCLWWDTRGLYRDGLAGSMSAALRRVEAAARASGLRAAYRPLPLSRVLRGVA